MSDRFDLPIVFHDDHVEVGDLRFGGDHGPGWISNEITVRVEEFPNGEPLYHVSVTFMTTTEPVVDPSAVLARRVDADQAYTITTKRDPDRKLELADVAEES